MRDDRKRVHVQPDTRTLNNHRRPPDLQMWLCQRECSPTLTTHESFCSPRPSASAGLHTVYTPPIVTARHIPEPAEVKLAGHGDRLRRPRSTLADDDLCFA